MLLLDTHVLLWYEVGEDKLGRRALRMIERGFSSGGVCVSAISFWEVGMQSRKHRLALDFDLDAWRRGLLGRGLEEIPIDGRIAGRAGLLTGMHGDPADRIIVSTALEGHQLVTADRRILDWPGNLKRINATG